MPVAKISFSRAKDAVKAMRKKLQQSAGKNHHAVELTLSIAETCVKNCGAPLHAQIANKEFLDELVRILNPKYNPSQAVQERILLLIQSWADAFRGISNFYFDVVALNKF